MWSSNPPNRPILNENETHVWQADLNVNRPLEAGLLSLLSSDETARAERFRFPGDRRNFTAARGILRLLLGRYLDVNASKVRFQYSANGKPFVPDGDSLHFNISHSENTALFAFTRKEPLGVDIEFVNPNIELASVAKRFFAPNEIKALFELPDDARVIGFYNCWTRKEAFIKAVGTGLGIALDRFEVSLSPAATPELLNCDLDLKHRSGWKMFSLDPKDGYVGALAQRKADIALSCWRTRAEELV